MASGAYFVAVVVWRFSTLNAAAVPSSNCFKLDQGVEKLEVKAKSAHLATPLYFASFVVGGGEWGKTWCSAKSGFLSFQASSASSIAHTSPILSLISSTNWPIKLIKLNLNKWLLHCSCLRLNRRILFDLSRGHARHLPLIRFKALIGHSTNNTDLLHQRISVSDCDCDVIVFSRDFAYTDE